MNKMIIALGLATSLVAGAAQAQQNTSTIVQDGGRNTSVTAQRGFDNLSTTVQRGRRNEAGVSQQGCINDAGVGQTARGRRSGNVAVVDQGGRC